MPKNLSRNTLYIIIATIAFVVIFLIASIISINYTREQTKELNQLFMSQSSSQSSTVGLKPAKLQFSTLELADTPQKRKTGLMNRTLLCDDCAMLFKFDKPNIESFWMKDTLIPLDIIFINNDGVITNICYNMQPNDITTDCSSNKPVQIVLETNPNFLKKLNLQEGSQLDLEYLFSQAKTKTP